MPDSIPALGWDRCPLGTLAPLGWKLHREEGPSPGEACGAFPEELEMFLCVHRAPGIIFVSAEAEVGSAGGDLWLWVAPGHPAVMSTCHGWAETCGAA